VYNNIGTKIKELAKFIAWMGIIGSAIICIILFVVDDDMAGICIGVLIGGSLISWISSLFMYGFGELINKTTEIARNTALTNSRQKKSLGVICTNCKGENHDNAKFCRYCGTPLDAQGTVLSELAAPVAEQTAALPETPAPVYEQATAVPEIPVLVAAQAANLPETPAPFAEGTAAPPQPHGEDFSAALYPETQASLVAVADLPQNLIKAIYCSVCGNPLNPYAAFCIRCGASAAPLSLANLVCGSDNPPGSWHHGGSSMHNSQSSSHQLGFCDQCDLPFYQGHVFCLRCGNQLALPSAQPVAAAPNPCAVP
jgi:uncharacterized OB-fold protein